MMASQPNKMGTKDEQLVREYLAGDGHALETLISRYLSLVYNFVYRLSGSREEANDITQDVFLKVWKHIKTFDQKLSFKAWILGIARNTAIDWHRKKKPLTFSRFETDNSTNTLEDTLSDPLPLPDELFEKKEMVLELEKTLPLISPDNKAILLLKHSEDLTFEEIAKIVGKPMNTVKSQYRRALIELREKLLYAPNKAL